LEVIEITKILVGFGKEGLKIWPGVIVGIATPFAAAFREHYGGEYKRVGDGDDLGGELGGLGGSCEDDGVFDLVEQCFDGLIWVVGIAKTGVVALEVCWVESAIGCV
jgi:hypothetical protein